MQKKILIVDDEPMIREIFREAFEMIGFFVEEAENGRDAFKILQDGSYDCVLSYVRMPGGDGVELAKSVHQMPGPKPKMFLVTGYMDMNFQNLKEFGVVNIFDKPFDFKDVLEQVGRAIGPA